MISFKHFFKPTKTPELETPKTNIFSQGIDENEISENEVN
jgi:hypothetical protein